MPRTLTLIVALVLAGSFASAQRTLNVPAQYKTMQLAIDAAADEDTVLVAPGLYRETIDFKGKAITLRGRDGRDLTIIYGDKSGPAVRMDHITGPAVLEGFTITNGFGLQIDNYGYGGGVYCPGSSPIIRRNTIALNEAYVDYHGGHYGMGGGIYCIDGAPVISGNVIANNKARACRECTGKGGGIYLEVKTGSTAVISGNTILENYGAYGGGAWIRGSVVIEGNTVSRNTSGGGSPVSPVGSSGGILCEGSVQILGNRFEDNQSPFGSGGGLTAIGTGLITGNLFRGNQCGSILRLDAGGGAALSGTFDVTANTVVGNQAATQGGGIAVGRSSNVILANMIVWNNQATTNPEIHVDSTAVATVTHCCVKGGWSGTGNIQADPLLVDEKADLHLTAPSPCRNGGTNTAPHLPKLDFEGDPRVAESTADIGADEFHPHLYHVGTPSPGSTIAIRLIGKPQDPACWGFSFRALDPPVPIPGLHGVLHLDPTGGIAVVPMFVFPPSGVIGISCPFPASFPRISIATQALMGLQLSNLDMVDVR